MKAKWTIVVLMLAGAVSAGAPSAAAQSAAAEPTQPQKGQLVTSPSGLQYADIIVGTGEMPRDGDICIVHYTGWFADGKQFDSSRTRGKPFGFKLGAHEVIRGWEEGVATMRVGGTRRLIIPPQLAYGSRGIPSLIPPDAQLTFEVELLKIKHAATPSATPQS